MACDLRGSMNKSGSKSSIFKRLLWFINLVNYKKR
jgi:hypothetical protein